MECMEWFVLALVLVFVGGILWMRAEITSAGPEDGAFPGESVDAIAVEIE